MGCTLSRALSSITSYLSTNENVYESNTLKLEMDHKNSYVPYVQNTTLKFE